MSDDQASYPDTALGQLAQLVDTLRNVQRLVVQLERDRAALLEVIMDTGYTEVKWWPEPAEGYAATLQPGEDETRGDPINITGHAADLIEAE